VELIASIIALGAKLGAEVVSSGGNGPLESGFVTASWITAAVAVVGVATALLTRRVRELREIR